MNSIVHVVCPHCDGINRLPAERLSESPVCGLCKRSLTTTEPLAVSVANFDRQVGRSDLPVLVDFWAPWCGPCRAMAPAFVQAAAQMAPAVRCLKVDTEAEPALAQRFGIRSIPTLAVFVGGREVARHSGAMDARSLVRWVSETIG